MKNRLPGLRNQLNSDPAYFKKVYMHTFDLAKAQGSRTLALDSGKMPTNPVSAVELNHAHLLALDLWTLYIPPALSSRPSALSRVVTPNASVATTSSTSDPPQFTNDDFDTWIEFQRKKGKAVSKDTWSLFVDFIRSIDGDFKEYDEEGGYPDNLYDIPYFFLIIRYCSGLAIRDRCLHYRENWTKPHASHTMYGLSCHP